ncbi:hypothetical protein LTR56_006239 [Elasticomyces elasticus]|nr:hypothetical protein LTR56_006239 [Elasticomyces elasticus]KAK3666552.1 hypothetical protein LTR22_002496 [Elasticomyces elasticus]KAK4928315.1 hypothetical protein LTR49_004992 [Elasticomyces elasticus]KAK5763878.1 hypothetical protein LTS12_005996 [Elasticomyces elasticus]
MDNHQPDIVLYFLEASRAIRIAWLLEELALPYTLVRGKRLPQGAGEPDFKKCVPTRLQKSPTIKDGNLVVQESSAICEYIINTYAPTSRLLPDGTRERAKVREWMAAAESTFMEHGLAQFYPRLVFQEGRHYLLPYEASLKFLVHRDMDWLEEELENSASGGIFLVGDSLTAADVMMGFSIEWLFDRRLGTDGGEWPRIWKWFDGITARPAYRTAVEKTKYSVTDLGDLGLPPSDQ